MSFLYRFAVAITRKQPYLDWANSLNDGVELTPEMSDENRTIYLVPETTPEAVLSTILDDYWEGIFELELGSWLPDDARWPSDRTRAMFDAWFDVDVTSNVYDLSPEEPLTQQQVEAMDLDVALSQCAWCEIDLEDGAGRTVAFTLAHRDRVSHREGLSLPIRIDEDRIVMGIVTPADSEPARAGDDLIFRVCTGGCERALRSAVPKALKKTFRD